MINAEVVALYWLKCDGPNCTRCSPHGDNRERTEANAAHVGWAIDTRGGRRRHYCPVCWKKRHRGTKGKETRDDEETARAHAT